MRGGDQVFENFDDFRISVRVLRLQLLLVQLTVDPIPKNPESIAHDGSGLGTGGPTAAIPIRVFGLDLRLRLRGRSEEENAQKRILWERCNDSALSSLLDRFKVVDQADQIARGPEKPKGSFPCACERTG